MNNWRKLKVRVPATSANLGPGFDTLAIAYKLYSTIEFEVLEKQDSSGPLISLKGNLEGKLSRDASNLVAKILKEECRDQSILQRLKISIKSEIPLARGLGSSASATVASLWAAQVLAGKTPDNEYLLARAAELEGHGDNAAAALHGGLVASARASGSAKLITQKLPWPENWASLIVVPPYELSTQKARSVLPDSYSRSDTVANLQKLAILLAAVQNQDDSAMREALSDERIHEPYRISLVPELAQLKKRLRDFPILGCVLSGAGSSILILLKQSQLRLIKSELEAWREESCPGAELLDPEVDQEGLKVSYE